MPTVAGKKSPWRFVKLAFALHAPRPAFHHVLLVLAGYANSDGGCFPSYERLMAATGYGSRQTIVDALKHWRDVGILTWRRGWGNEHRKMSSSYQFNENAMRRQIAAQSTAEESPLDGHSSLDESPLRPDESPLDERGKSTQPSQKVHSVDSKVLYLEGPMEGPRERSENQNPLSSSLKAKTQEESDLCLRLYQVGRSVSSNHPTFTSNCRKALAGLLTRYTAKELTEAYKEFVAHLDDFQIRHAPKEFCDGGADVVIQAMREGLPSPRGPSSSAPSMRVDAIEEFRRQINI